MTTRKIKDAVDLASGKKVYYKGCANVTYLSDGRTVEDAIMACSGMRIVDHGVNDTTFELTPNIVHKWGVVQNLTITIPEDEEGKENQYSIVFTADSDFSLTLSSNIQWENDEIPVFWSGEICEINITGKRAVYTKFNLSVDNVPQVANVGDIAYKASNGKIKVVAPDAWNSALGTPIGVVVIPSGFAPDNGLARIVSLYWASASGTGSTSKSYIQWSNTTANTPLTKCTKVPITDNAGSTITGSDSFGYLPSDKFTGTASYVDSTAKYYDRTPYIPSPYLGDKPNPAYYTAISGFNNALSDFNGKSNTDVLVALGGSYKTANSARNYKAAGAEDIEWYLPAMGELGYLMVRFNKIQDTLTKVGASQLDDSNGRYWSSTEFSMYDVYFFGTSYGNVTTYSKNTTCIVRPFAQLDF